MDKKINNKILIIAIAIVGVAAVSFLGYFLYLRYSLKKSLPSSEETTNITNSTTTLSSEDINKILEKISAPVATNSLTNSLETKNNSIPDDKLRIIKQKLSAPKGSSVTIPKEILDKLSAPK